MTRLLLALVIAGMAGTAWGQDAHQHWKYDAICCQGTEDAGDCQSIPYKSVQAVDGGYEITLGPGDHRLVKNGTHVWFKRMSEARISKDENYHACLYPSEEELRCFYAPPMGF